MQPFSICAVCCELAAPGCVGIADIPTPYIIEIMRELSLRVDLLCLFCAARAGRGMNWNFDKNLGFRHFVIGGARIKRADSTDYYVSPRIFWRLVRARPDTVISGGYSIPSVYAYLYSKLTGAKLIIYSDGTSAYEKKLGWLQHAARKVLVPRVSGFIAQSRPAADRFEELGAKKRCIFLAPHTTNMAPLLAIGANRNWSESAELRLLAVGRLIPRKGVRHLVRALAVMRPVRRPVSLTIVGSGPEEPELRALVQSLGVPGVRFVGFVDDKAIRGMLALSSLLLEPRFSIILLISATAQLGFMALAFVVLANSMHLVIAVIAEPQILLFMPFISLVSSPPIFYVGWGAREAATVLTFCSMSSISPPEAVALSLAFGVCFLIASLPGAFFWLLRPSMRKAVTDTALQLQTSALTQ